MADAVVTDSAKTVVFDDRDRSYGPKYAIEPPTSSLVETINVGNQTSHILNALLSQFGFIREGIGRVGNDVRDVGHGLSKEICDARDTTRSDGAVTREALNGASRHIVDNLHATHTDLAKGICDTRDAVRSEAANVRADVATTREAVRLEGCQTREVVKDQVNTHRMETLRGIADVQLEAAKNYAALSKQMSECCCELKERIHHEGEASRNLFTSNELARLREENTLLKINVRVG